MELIISPALANLPRIGSNELEDLQGNLKDLTESNYGKLKRSLENEGFIFPLFVWVSPDGEKYSFDGHQRLRLIQREIPGGILLPYVQVEADSREEAKRKLLLFNSQYGNVTKDGWDEFIAELSDTSFVNDMTTFQGFLDENWNMADSDATAGTDSSDSAGSGLTDADLPTYRIEAVCVSEREQEELFNELTERGYQCKVLTL
jgi:hypothetical protein